MHDSIINQDAVNSCLHSVRQAAETAKNVGIVVATYWICRVTYRVFVGIRDLATDRSVKDSLARIAKAAEEHRDQRLMEKMRTNVPPPRLYGGLFSSSDEEENDKRKQSTGVTQRRLSGTDTSTITPGN